MTALANSLVLLGSTNIPLNSFWCMNSKVALPLISLEYADLEIDITIRPVKELYTIINTTQDISGTYIHQQLEENDSELSRLMHDRPYVRTAPDYSDTNHQLKNFIYPTKRTQLELDDEPESIMTESEKDGWRAQREDWNADVHLIGNYVFLSDDESDVFKNSTQEYLYRQCIWSNRSSITNKNGSKNLKEHTELYRCIKRYLDDMSQEIIDRKF